MVETIFIILGATGDLTKRKLIPAIYKLIEDKKIGKFCIVGVASSANTSEQILEQASQFVDNKKQDIWDCLKNCFYYYQMDFYDSKSYVKLHELIDSIEQEKNIKGNKIFYLATLPEHFEVITKNLSKNKIVHKCDSSCCWDKIVYEKPFGQDLKSCRKINKAISKLFSENQIYRIDHYLAKDLVYNIALIRFTNKIFEPLWNNKNIDSVQIILSEDIGIEGRGSSYDKYGALKDVVQNHMLQILSLITMEQPNSLTSQDIRDVKAKVLKKVKIDSVVLGQYDGYKQEPKVNPESKTETFAALKLFVNNKRWAGVPFYLKTGKFLDKKQVSVHIRFKMIKCLLTQGCPIDANYLNIMIDPDDGFNLELNTKIPGFSDQIMTGRMDFCHKCVAGPNSPAAYEILLNDVINGDQSTFVRYDEIETCWKIIGQINKLDKNSLKIYSYEKNSKGPKELELLDKNKKIIWKG